MTEEVECRHGKHGEEHSQTARESMTIAVMQESLLGSVWSYPIETKGANEQWMIEQMLEDVETVGFKNERVVIQSDQESAIIDVLKEIQRRRESDYGTAIDSSKGW